MAGYFVTSFAAAEKLSYAARFHQDLITEVSRRASRQVVGHMCGPAVPPEQRRRLIAQAGALVVLWSPDYFEDPACDGDWKLFERRLALVPASRRQDVCHFTRVLVRWRTAAIPRPNVPRPPMFGRDVMADCNKHGLFKVIWEQGPASSAYRSALGELAERVRAALMTPLPALGLPAQRPVVHVPPPDQRPAPRPAPRVLISYAHDPQVPGHAEDVKALARLLKAEGVDVRLDQDADGEPQNWVRWMSEELELADRIIMVASPAYRRRVEGREAPGTGRGATWEGGYLRDYVYTHPGTWEKHLLRVVFPRASDDDLPVFSGSASVTVYHVDPATGDGDLTRLLGYLTKGPATTP